MVAEPAVDGKGAVVELTRVETWCDMGSASCTLLLLILLDTLRESDDDPSVLACP